MKKLFFVFGFISLFCIKSKAQDTVSPKLTKISPILIKISFSNTPLSSWDTSDTTEESVEMIDHCLPFFYFPDPDQYIIDAEDYRHLAK